MPDQLIALEHELQSAVHAQDRETLERLLAPGFRLATTAPTGPTSSVPPGSTRPPQASVDRPPSTASTCPVM
jgi:hypothetical protein